MKYVTAKDIKEIYHISGTTLQRWKENGNIKYKQVSPKKILYLLPETSDDILQYSKSIVGFVSLEHKDEEIIRLSKAYYQLNPTYSISQFFDDSYKDVDDPFNKNSLLAQILNKSVLNILLSKPVNEYNNYNNLIFILKSATTFGINIYIYDEKTQSFQIYTGLITDMLDSLKSPVTYTKSIINNYSDVSSDTSVKALNEACNSFANPMYKKDDLTERLINTKTHKKAQIIRISKEMPGNDIKNFENATCYTPTELVDMINEKIQLSQMDCDKIYNLLNDNIFIEKEIK